MRRRWSLALLASSGLLAASAPAASADMTCAATPAGYPSVGRYAVFALNAPGAKQTANFSNDTVNGDVAVAAGAGVTNQAPSTINGSVFAAGSFAGPGK